MKPRKIPKLKPLFLERMQKLLTDEKDFKKYLEILKVLPAKSIRCNTLKISPEKLKKKLEEKGWKIKQPWKNYPEVMVVENELLPGELGRALEHLLGYYYIQELASMLPVIALRPKENKTILDLCSSPGSKTTQTSSLMKNSGSIIANEISLGRIKILASNLERCGVTNAIITKKNGIDFCKKLFREKTARFQKDCNKEIASQGQEGKIQKNRLGCFDFDKILVDAPCSGEGTLRSSLKTYLMWNFKTIKTVSRLQKNLIAFAFEILKTDGVLVYSTCTHAPEENEEVVDFILKKFKGRIKIEKINLPVKFREGITEWENKKFSNDVKKSARIYPHDNNTEGFFISKFRKIG